jgi:hypothetical protein
VARPFTGTRTEPALLRGWKRPPALTKLSADSAGQSRVTLGDQRPVGASARVPAGRHRLFGEAEPIMGRGETLNEGQDFAAAVNQLTGTWGPPRIRWARGGRAAGGCVPSHPSTAGAP